MNFDPKDCKVLTASGSYRILSHFESAYLYTGDAAYDIGDLDGEPACALMDIEAGWCAVGGHGLHVSNFGTQFEALKMEQPDYTTSQVIWRGHTRPNFTGLWRVDEFLIHGLSNPGLEDAALFEINVSTLTFRRI